MDLRGATALVTGGNGGLGQRICHALAKEGVHVAVMYARSRDQAEGVAGELTSRHQINAAAFACDSTDGAAVERVVGGVTGRFGRLDILVNDAAYNIAVPFPDLDNLTMEEWDKIIAINLTGPMRLMKAAAPIMKAQGRGRIVNISSVAGVGPTGSSIAYAVSKAGLIHLTRCMAVALAPETLVNCVAPGLLDGTRATANLRPEQIERSASTSLLQRPADKDDCADMVVAMCRTETITLVVPFAAGGGTDTVARLIGEQMSRTLGQTIIIENVVGGGSTLANDRVARSAPDGSTVLINHVALLAAPSLFTNLRYDTN